MKTCNKCNIPKELDEFPKSKRTKDGAGWDCKVCIKEYNKIYRKNNREKILAKHKEHYQNNKDYHREYREIHKKKRKKFQDEYYKKNSEKLIENYHQYSKKK